MVKAHEIKLSTGVFNQFEQNYYIIIEDKENKIEVNDYILFKQVETVEEKTTETGLHRLTQVKDIITHQGLKDGYKLIFVNKY